MWVKVVYENTILYLCILKCDILIAFSFSDFSYMHVYVTNKTTEEKCNFNKTIKYYIVHSTRTHLKKSYTNWCSIG